MTEPKNSLVNIIADKQQALSIIEDLGGEVSEPLEQLLDQIGKELAHKVDSTVIIENELRAQAEYFKELALTFIQKAKSLTNAADRIKERVKYVMVTDGIMRLDGNLHGYSLSNSKPKLTIDESKLDSQFLIRVIPEPYSEPDKEKITEVLKSGTKLDGAELTPVFALRTVIAKKPKLKG